MIPGRASTHRVLGEVFTACTAQDRAAAAAGLGPLPDGTGRPHDRHAAAKAAELVAVDSAGGRLTHRAVLMQHVTAAFAELDPTRLRDHLIEIGAASARWALALDERQAGPRLAEGPEPSLFPEPQP
ncbi:hypothetical protein DMC64_41460 [Amycolatopsis sp. WAC 04197]|uniref:hypothetical protein n=1 Tax=Amycolatopsis sp. WAC 04197 TaxID=2203199 RepID=UPI000F766BF0|nr:hypothetical protein [Amycolatopsis sp. WAC 04197]RSN38538.1 hypothetical protein DMC64_41460 [Amycolatopsis sp. WAC 04197]